MKKCEETTINNPRSNYLDVKTIKRILPALLAGAMMLSSISAVQAEKLSEALDRANREWAELSGYTDQQRLVRAQRQLAESQLRRESTQQMRDETMIMNGLNYQLEHGLPVPGYGHSRY